jgi:hypothetical protein
MKDLPVYLNDHLAGSVGAMEMIGDLIDTHEGRPVGDFLKVLEKEIRDDQGELQRLMQGLGIKESKVRKAGAWVAEKGSRLKLRIADFGESNLALLQSLETLSIGIMGKRLLWRTLDAAIATTMRQIGLDPAKLERRAAGQFERVEEQVFEIARQIFVAEIHRAGKSSER